MIPPEFLFAGRGYSALIKGMLGRNFALISAEGDMLHFVKVGDHAPGDPLLSHIQFSNLGVLLKYGKLILISCPHGVINFGILFVQGR